VLIEHQEEDADDIHDGIIQADGISITCSGQCLPDILVDFLACYYAWDLKYPRQYQILPLLQRYVLKDCSEFFQGSALVKLIKELDGDDGSNTD
jgi:hypothetical protein